MKRNANADDAPFVKIKEKQKNVQKDAAERSVKALEAAARMSDAAQSLKASGSSTHVIVVPRSCFRSTLGGLPASYTWLYSKP